MPSALTHSLVAGGIGFGLAVGEQTQDSSDSPHPATAAVVTAILTRLPGYLEPATSPNHRQFFHSVAFGVVVAYGTYRAYKWQPAEKWERTLRWVGIAVGVAYLAHLACDGLTAKSLPFMGRLG